MMRYYGLQEIDVICVDDRSLVRYDFMEYFIMKNSWHICISFLEGSRCNLIIRLCTKTKSSLLPYLKYATYYRCRRVHTPKWLIYHIRYSFKLRIEMHTYLAIFYSIWHFMKSYSFLSFHVECQWTCEKWHTKEINISNFWSIIKVTESCSGMYSNFIF